LIKARRNRNFLRLKVKQFNTNDKLKKYYKNSEIKLGRGNKQNVMNNVILYDGIELNVKNNGRIISNRFNDFLINVKSDLLIKLRNQQNIINDNTNVITSSLLSIGRINNLLWYNRRGGASIMLYLSMRNMSKSNY